MERMQEVQHLFEELRAKDGKVMTDGIMNNEKYAEAWQKIMWMPKQSCDWGIFDYGALMANDNHRYMRSDPAWRRIARATAGILYPQKSFEEIVQMDNDALYDAALHTAFVNIVKDAGGIVTPDGIVLNGWEKYKTLIFKQIDAYNPDIIACCIGVRECMKPIIAEICRHFLGVDFDFAPSQNVEYGGFHAAVVKNNGKRLIWSYHPSARGKGKSDEAWFHTITESARW